MFSLKCLDQPWGSPSLLIILCRSSFPRLKLGCDVEHAPPYSAEVRNEWSYTSSPLMCLQGMDRDCYTR
jgi:hypothetical protein